MPDENKCPQCGTPLPSGALAGLCPACLLKLGATDDSVTEGAPRAFVPPGLAELSPLWGCSATTRSISISPMCSCVTSHCT